MGFKTTLSLFSSCNGSQNIKYHVIDSQNFRKKNKKIKTKMQRTEKSIVIAYFCDIYIKKKNFWS